MRLTILHFNDLHGRLEQLPRLATLIQRERTEALTRGRTVLVLDGGDSSDRAVWESDITHGRANFAMLEAMGVQATVVGNGEALQWGRTALQKLVASVHFPVLAANLVDLADPSRLAVPGLQASCVIQADGFKIGIIGVTAVYTNGYDRFGYISTDPLPALQREVAALKTWGAHFILLLSHLGYATSEEKKTWLDPNAFTDDEAATACPEIGAIVGGHSHVLLEAPVMIGDIPIVQAGEYGRYLGRLDLDVNPDTGRVVRHEYCLLPTEDVLPASTISATEEFVREEASHLLDIRLGTASVDLPHFFDQSSPFANRVADALRAICQAELGILFSGFVYQGLKAGPITRRDLYEAIPGSSHVTAAQVSGAQIRRMVERMLASPYRTESFNPKRNSPPLGLPACSTNVQLVYDLPSPFGSPTGVLREGAGGEDESSALNEILIDGRPLDSSHRYRLASTYYTLNPITDEPEYDYIGLEPGQVIENVRVEEVLWEIVEDWIKTAGPIA
jgi:2',3'-cyclic-nucleotide 2'-phosphodiesterase (5'-nucleotidase family)